MSKLVEKLKQASEREAQPLGFGTKASVKKPQMVLMASLTKDDIKMATSAVEGGADALLVALHSVAEEANELDQILQLAADVPCGVWSEAPTAEEMKQVREMGCDFVLFDGAKTPSGLLREEELGRVIKVEHSLADSLVRTIDRLPIDALFIDCRVEEKLPLSVYQLMAYHRLAALTRKPLLVVAPSLMSDLDVETLWEVGIVGILLKAEAGPIEDRLSVLRQAIDKLPSSRKRPRPGEDAVLPHLGEQPPPPQRERPR